MEKINGKELIEIKNQIARQFTKSDWLELGYTLDSYEIINGHERLLRSLSFGDDDYEGNILDVLTKIIKKNPNNLEEIKSYLSNKYAAPEVSDFISTAHTEIPKKLISFSPQVFEVPNKPQQDELVAVMLPFKLDKTFVAVSNACKNLNVDCKKADDIWENATFIQDIFELIFTCKAVVADFSGKNPNVFYEVGIAHTLGKTVIPITQSFDDVPTDLGHHRALKYLPNDQGYLDLTKELEKRIRTLIPETPKW
jgi:hypothetical protein